MKNLKSSIQRLFFAALILLLAVPAFSQKEDDAPVKVRTTSSAKKKKKEEVKFKDKLWYGGGVNLGFNGYNGASVFSFGLSPMVGYKIWGPFSVGPRVSVSFSSYKEQGFKALSLFDVEAGAFARAKIWGPIFAHVEGANQWTQYPNGFADPNTQKLLKDTYERFNQYVGLGYNNGNGGFGYEIMILYNFGLRNDINTSQNPLNFRIGFTYKF